MTVLQMGETESQRGDVTFWGLWTPRLCSPPPLPSLSLSPGCTLPWLGWGGRWAGKERHCVRDKGPLWLHNGDNQSQMIDAGLQEQLGTHLQLPPDNGEPVLPGGVQWAPCVWVPAPLWG